VVNLAFTEWVERICYYNHSNRILCFGSIHTHTRHHENSQVQWNTHFKSSDFSMGEGWLSRSAQVVHALLWEVSHPEGVTGRTCCRPEALKGPFLVPLFVRSQDDWLWASVIFPPGHNPHDAVLVFRQKLRNPVLPRTYSSDIYQAGATPGIRSSRCGQGVPDRPSSLLLYRDKESTKWSRFTTH